MSGGPTASRVRLDLEVDLAAIRRDVEALATHAYLHYSVLALTMPRPRNSGPIEDYADGTWADWMPTDSLAASPALTELVERLGAQTRVTLVRLLRLAPGATVESHTDPTLGLHVERSLIRLTIPIVSNDRVVFVHDEEPVPWREGECWYLDFTKPHHTWNAGTTERIHASIDVEPNAWIRELVSAGARAG